MDYQITCICGHRFLVPQEKVTGVITCPACHQRLSPVIEASPPPASAALLPAGASAAPGDSPSPDSPPVSAEAEATKRCPYCGEVILAVARKCKHCGEFLDRQPPLSPASPGAPGAAAGAAHNPADDEPAYSLSVSQWDNFWKFLITFTLALVVSAVFIYLPSLKKYAPVAVLGCFVIAALSAWYFYLAAKHTRCYIRPLRIDTEEGILSKNLNSLDLFRVVHMDLKQGLVERLLGIGTIVLTTADTDEPELMLYQIPHVRQVYKYIQTQIPIAARQRGAIYMEK